MFFYVKIERFESLNSYHRDLDLWSTFISMLTFFVSVIETIGQQHPIKQKRVKRQILHDNAHQYKAEFEHLADGPKEIAKTYPPSCGSKKG